MVVTTNLKILTASDDPVLSLYEVVLPSEHLGEVYPLLRLVETIHELQKPIANLYRISDELIVSGSAVGDVIVWSIENQTLDVFFQLTTNVAMPRALLGCPSCSVGCVLPVDERFLFISTGSSFTLYDLSYKRTLSTQRSAHLMPITDMCLTIQGHVLATSSSDGTIRLWIPTTSSWPEMVRKENEPWFENFYGRSVRDVLVMDIGFQLIGECSGHMAEVKKMVDLPGVGLASCGSDGLVILWKNYWRVCLDRKDAVDRILHQIYPSSIADPSLSPS